MAVVESLSAIVAEPNSQAISNLLLHIWNF
jgi:hypothetical protein